MHKIRIQSWYSDVLWLFKMCTCNCFKFSRRKKGLKNLVNILKEDGTRCVCFHSTVTNLDSRKRVDYLYGWVFIFRYWGGLGNNQKTKIGARLQNRKRNICAKAKKIRTQLRARKKIRARVALRNPPIPPQISNGPLCRKARSYQNSSNMYSLKIEMDTKLFTAIIKQVDHHWRCTLQKTY